MLKGLMWFVLGAVCALAGLCALAYARESVQFGEHYSGGR